MSAGNDLGSSRSRFASSSSEVDINFKVMLIGDSGVGKTCLLMRYKDDTFLSGSFISTVGIDFRNKIITIDEHRIKLQIWDTAGQERFRSVTHAYYRDADALMLVYDVTKRLSFNNVQSWIADVRQHAQQKVTTILIGNKADCDSSRAVSLSDGEEMAKQLGVVYLETSARTGMNVDLSFYAIAKELHRKSLTASGCAGPNKHFIARSKDTFDIERYIQSKKETVPCCG